MNTRDLHLLLTGQLENKMVEIAKGGPKLLKEVVPHFLALQKAASAAGFEMTIVSGFRSFQRQLLIWNEKATGRRPINASVPFDKMSEDQIVFAILRWSALPGASRHHWGTDFDVIDKKVMPEGYQVQLTPEEASGLFGPMHEWLDKNLSKFNFFRPYSKDLRGVSPERWHLSYAPLADKFLNSFDPSFLKERIEQSEIALKPYIIKNFDEIVSRFILNIG